MLSGSRAGAAGGVEGPTDGANPRGDGRGGGEQEDVGLGGAERANCRGCSAGRMGDDEDPSMAPLCCGGGSISASSRRAWGRIGSLRRPRFGPALIAEANDLARRAGGPRGARLNGERTTIGCRGRHVGGGKASAGGVSMRVSGPFHASRGPSDMLGGRSGGQTP